MWENGKEATVKIGNCRILRQDAKQGGGYRSQEKVVVDVFVLNLGGKVTFLCYLK